MNLCDTFSMPMQFDVLQNGKLVTFVVCVYTMQETLRKAEEIFGTDNKDLYLLFQGLLNRSVH